MAIQMRRGLRADFDPYKMLPGEWAVSIDASTSNQIVWMCFEPGVCKRMGTYEDFVEQVKEATADVKTEYVEEFDKILDEIKVLSSQVSDDKDTVVLVKTTIEDEYLPQIQEALSEIQGKVSESKNSADAAAVSAENAKKSEVNAKTYAEQAKTASGEQVALNRQTLGYSKKNLLKNTATTKTANGITFTVNEDGSISVKGTATAANYAFTVGKFKPMPNKTYIFTANSEVPGGNSSLGNNYCFIYNIDGVPAWKSDVFASDGTHVPYEFTPTTDTEITCQIYVAKGTTVENLTFYPMIRSAEITDGTYEPYVDDVDTRLQKIDDSILNTLEEIDANTSEGNIAGALALKKSIVKSTYVSAEALPNEELDSDNAIGKFKFVAPISVDYSGINGKILSTSLIHIGTDSTNANGGLDKSLLLAGMGGDGNEKIIKNILVYSKGYQTVRVKILVEYVEN